MHDPNKGIRARRPGTSRMSPSVIQNCLPSPGIDLHMSGTTTSLATVLRSALSPPAKTGGRRRKERYFAPSGTLHDLPNVLIGALNAQYLTRRHEYGEAARSAGERGPRKVPEARRRRDPRPVAEGWQLFGERHPAGRGAGAKRPARRRPPPAAEEKEGVRSAADTDGRSAPSTRGRGVVVPDFPGSSGWILPCLVRRRLCT